MSKEVWLRAYERVYDEHPELPEEKKVKLTNERAAHMEAALIDEAMNRLKYGE